mmetsp:Transcript_9646/g.15528  ORF Transcript_9646/g.15528 Transcript_9646/m.15528 type:complete len:217 (-) Transcript_9646:124-774(-)
MLWQLILSANALCKTRRECKIFMFRCFVFRSNLTHGFHFILHNQFRNILGQLHQLQSEQQQIVIRLISVNNQAPTAEYIRLESIADLRCAYIPQIFDFPMFVQQLMIIWQFVLLQVLHVNQVQNNGERAAKLAAAITANCSPWRRIAIETVQNAGSSIPFSCVQLVLVVNGAIRHGLWHSMYLDTQMSVLFAAASHGVESANKGDIIHHDRFRREI